MQGISNMKAGVAGSGGSLRRFAALSAIASGVIGLMGFVFLIAFFALEAPAVMKSGNLTASTFFGVLSNICGIAQMLLLIIVAVALAQSLAQHGSGRIAPLRRVGLACGVAGTVVMAAATVLSTMRVGAVGQVAMASMLGLAAVGLWLVISNYLGRADEVLSPRLAWLGVAVGAGIIIMAISFLGAGGPSMMQDPSSIPANFLVLTGIGIGTLALQIGLPLWSILLGRTLLKGDRI
jgi:hypothetical protein